ncbi:MAG: hypothetical protein KY475_09040 [Planctomycetes bacterium]|nr:hypothetical protein [Planctomycetota bacterium]
MSEEFLGDRRRALEESFFAKQNQQLLDELRKEVKAEESRKMLCSASGIQDEAVLDRLAGAGIDAQTFAALTLAPLVEVAWAEGGVAEKERAAVLRAAEESGVAQDSPAHRLLENWLSEKPGPQLLATWKEYVAALQKSVDPQTFQSLRDTILDRAESVAQAAGGFLGVASVSSKEKAVLAELHRAFAS